MGDLSASTGLRDRVYGLTVTKYVDGMYHRD